MPSPGRSWGAWAQAGRTLWETAQYRWKEHFDEVELLLAAGRNELLFKVTQAGGDFGLAVDARVLGPGKVEQVANP